MRARGIPSGRTLREPGLSRQPTNASPPVAPDPGRASAWGGWGPTLALVLGVLALKLLYLAFACPYALVEDEAHYWEWSRRLDWSYYSKGPGVAWAIRASVEVFGTSELGVRVPAALASALGALGVAWLARDIARGAPGGDRAWAGRAPLYAAACFMLVPAFLATGLLMTIDGPFLAAWALAACGAWAALARGARAGWLVLAGAVALGFLFKYTILLVLPGVALAAWWGRHDRTRSPLPAGVLLGVLALLALGLAPVAIWNANHDWATVRHLLGHLGAPGGDTGGRAWSYSPLWTLEFVGTQLGLVGPVWALGIGEVLAARRARHADPARWRGARFLVALGAPVVVFYLFVTLVTNAEGNWALGGYVTLVVLGGLHAARGMHEWSARRRAWRALPEPRPRAGWVTRRPETPAQVAWHATLGVGLVVAVCGLRLDLLGRLPGIGPLVPVGRLRIGPAIAFDAGELGRRVREQTGQEPFYICDHYGRASLLAFYLPGRPGVTCSSSLMGGRRTQYDAWPDTDLRDLSRFGGRPAVLLGADDPAWRHAFERVEVVGPLPSEYKRGRTALVGYGYRGWGSPTHRP